MTQLSALAPSAQLIASRSSVPFLTAVRARTKHLHICAEQSGIIADILNNRATIAAYALWIRNLLPAYTELEAGLYRPALSAGARLLRDRRVFRAPAIRHDLTVLYGSEWATQLRLLPAGKAYARHVASLATDSSAGLIAHAYVRYLGDLSGGQVLRKILKKNLGLTEDSLSYYAFPKIKDVSAFKDEFRQLIDQAADLVDDADALIKEACVAFELNVQVSEEVQSISQQCTN